MAEVMVITYCTEWNYLPFASSLAAAIKDKFGKEVELKKGRNGILKVTTGETVIYDNKCSHLPTIDEVVNTINKTK